MQRNLQRKSMPCCLRGELPAPPNNTKIKNMNQSIEAILEQADVYGLRSEVRATAIAIVRENPSLPTGSAYMMAAQEWDIL